MTEPGPQFTKWFPVAVIIGLTCTCIGLNSPILSTGTLRLACKELGYPTSCDNEEATNLIADYNGLVALVSGVCMIISMGLWTVLAHKVGRHRTIAISLGGIGCLVATWATIFRFESLQPYWRYIALSAVAFNCFTGTVVIVYLGCFGYANDITHGQRSYRSWLYCVLESIIGCTYIISAKGSAYLVKLPLYYPLYGVAITLWCLALSVLFFLPNTISPREQSTPIQWARATLISALTIIIPTASNIKRLRQETKQDEVVEEQEEGGQQQEPQQESQQEPQTPNILDITTSGIEEPLLASPGPDGDNIHNTSDDRNDPLLSENQNKNSSTKEQHFTPLYLLPLLAIAFFGIYFVMYGRKTIVFLYFKREYKINADQYANLLTMDAIGNAVAVIFVLPMIKHLLKRFASKQLSLELISCFTGLILQGTMYILIPLLPMLIGSGGGAPNKIWACYILLFFCGFLSSIPTGIIRTTMVNSAHSSKQRFMLSFLTAAEALSLIFSGLCLNKAFQHLGANVPYFLMGTAHLTGAVTLIISLILYSIYGDDSHHYIFPTVEEEEAAAQAQQEDKYSINVQ